MFPLESRESIRIEPIALLGRPELVYCQTAFVPSALGLGREVRVDDGLRQLRSDDALTERKHVHVDVLHAVARRPFLAHDRGAPAEDLARRHGRADATAAAEDAALELAPHYRPRQWDDEVDVVDAGFGIRAEVAQLVTSFAKVCEQDLLELEAGMIATDRDLHATAASNSASRVIAPSRRITSCSPEQSTTVLATPPGVGPPSRTSSIRPFS